MAKIDFDITLDTLPSKDLKRITLKRGRKGSRYAKIDKEALKLKIGKTLIIKVPAKDVAEKRQRALELRRMIAQRIINNIRPMQMEKDDVQYRYDMKRDFKSGITEDWNVIIDCIRNTYTEEDYERDKENTAKRLAGREKAAKMRKAKKKLKEKEEEEPEEEEELEEEEEELEEEEEEPEEEEEEFEDDEDFDSFDDDEEEE